MEQAQARERVASTIEWEGAFKNVHAFSVFIGHNRCGTSLVGALIDAHPNAAIPHQGKIFGRDETAGQLVFERRRRLFRWIVVRSAGQAIQGRSGQRRTPGSRRQRYSYDVPGQWQGRFTDLQVIGTKHAAEVSTALGASPQALDDLAKLAKLPLKLINMVRNPWDNVASLGVGVPANRVNVRAKVVDNYVFNATMIGKAKDRGYEVIDVHLDDLTQDPRSELRRLCEFLGLERLPDYLDACAEVVFDSPNEPHQEHEWTEFEVERITNAISEFPWLQRYAEVEPPVPA